MRCSLILACPVLGRCPRQESHYQQDIDVDYIYVGSNEYTYCPAAPTSDGHQGPDPLDAYCSIYQALNEGLTQADGDIVAMIHVCDRFAVPSVLAMAAQTLEKTGSDALYADLAYVSGGGSDRPLRYWHSGHICAENIACGWTPPLACLVARRQVFERLRNDQGKFFSESPFPDPWRQAFTRMVCNGIRIAYVPRVWVHVPTYSPTNQVLSRMISCQDL